jgi:hypothetical protein
MGGYGSTRWLGHRRLQRAEEAFFALRMTDLLELTRGLKCLANVKGARGKLEGVRSDGTIPAQTRWHLTQQADGHWTFTLEYAVVQGDEEGRKESRCIPLSLTATRPGFGGWRWWFLCPRCERRCAVVFWRTGVEASPACRTCSQVRYASQLCDAGERLYGRAGKLMRSVEGNPELALGRAFPERPARMHRTTYGRLAAAYHAVLDARDDWFVFRHARFLYRIGVISREQWRAS